MRLVRSRSEPPFPTKKASDASYFLSQYFLYALVILLSKLAWILLSIDLAIGKHSNESLVGFPKLEIPTTTKLSLANRKHGWNIYSHYGKIF